MNPKTFLLISQFILFHIYSFSQQLDKAISFGGSYIDKAFDIEQDATGNVYITGGISNSVNMNPLGAPFYLSVPGTNSSDVFIARYNKDFLLEWAFRLGGDDWDSGAGLLVDDSQNVYIIGNAIGLIDFDPTSAIYEYNCSPSNTFVAKYDANGQFISVNRIPSIMFNPPEIQLFSDQEMFVYTYSGDTMSKFDSLLTPVWKKRMDGSPEQYTEQAFCTVRNFKTPHYSSMFTQQQLLLETYSKSNGSMIMSREYGFCNGFISGGMIHFTKNNRLIISGKFWGTLSLYGVNDTITFINSDMGSGPTGPYPIERAFIAMYDTVHTLYWAKAFDEQSTEPYIIRSDDAGYIYTIGSMHYLAAFDPEAEVVIPYCNCSYIARYDSTFHYTSASVFLGGSLNDYVGDFYIDGDTALLCGHFFNTIDIDLTTEVFTLSATPPEDIFIARYTDFKIQTHPATLETHANEHVQLCVRPSSVENSWDFSFRGKNTDFTVYIYNLNGQLCTTGRSNTNSCTIQLIEFPPSLYLYKVVQDNRIFSGKISKF